MIYLGHFSFCVDPSRNPGETDPRHGYCTCVAEAESIDAALDTFRSLLHRFRVADDLFDGIVKVYLDSCVEIRSIPAGGFVAHYSERRGEHPGEISTSVRGAGEDQAAAYYVGPDDEDRDDTTAAMEPFIVFPL